MLEYRAMTESGQYDDLIQGNFEENYRNETLQLLVGLKWVVDRCGRRGGGGGGGRPKYILVTKDDSFIHIFNLVKFLKEAKGFSKRDTDDSAESLTANDYIQESSLSYPSSSFSSSSSAANSSNNNFFICAVNQNVSAMRESTGENSRWNVSPEEFPDNVYPPYCNSIGYILPGGERGGRGGGGGRVGGMVELILDEAQKMNYFFISDVFVTGILARKLRIRHVTLGAEMVGTSFGRNIDASIGFFFSEMGQMIENMEMI